LATETETTPVPTATDEQATTTPEPATTGQLVPASQPERIAEAADLRPPAATPEAAGPVTTAPSLPPRVPPSNPPAAAMTGVVKAALPATVPPQPFFCSTREGPP
jgi:hypothetical protein